MARVLVVEDDPNILLSVEFLLRHAGHEVDTCADGLHAARFIENSTPDLVVLDIMLPGLDGFELCRRLRAAPSPKPCKILVLSARGASADIDKALQLGADAYLRKPFATRELMDSVARLLGS
jgi:DNA-binding response OmpR family regulator